jgi:hypothetical protein
MPATHDPVTFTPEERQPLRALVSTGKTAAYRLTRARILLHAKPSPHGPAWSDAPIHQALHVGRQTVERTRETCVAIGLAAALQRNKRARPGPQKFDGRNEAHLIAVACSKPPAGPTRWT